MSSAGTGVVPTRTIDLSGLLLGDLSRQDPAHLAQASARLIREVTESAGVSLAGSQS